MSEPGAVARVGFGFEAPGAFDEILGSLREPRGANELPDWLLASYQAPEPFFRGLFAHVRSHQKRLLKSYPFSHYDFYHDLVTANLGLGRTALSHHQGGGAFQDLSYDDLHYRSTALLAQWEARGLVAGVPVVLVLDAGIDFAVCLLALLRIGAVVSVVFPQGRSLSRERLDTLDECFVVGDRLELSNLGIGEPWMLPARPDPHQGGSSRTLSFAYPAGAPVLRALSPFSGSPTWIEVSAGELYLGLLRDAHLLFALRPGERVAIPGFEPQQYQPQFLLMTLLAGSCLVDCRPAELDAYPAAWSELKAGVLGVGAELRERLPTTAVRALDGVRLWFYSVTEKLEPGRWAAVADRFSERRVPGMNLASSSSFGGAFLFSRRKLRPDGLSMLPVPGEPWALLEPNQSGQESLTGSGILACPRSDSVGAVGEFLLGRTADAYAFGGSIRLCRSGRGFPEATAARVIERHPLVQHASVMLVPGNSPNDCRVLAVLFVDPLLASHLPREAPKWAAEVRASIQSEMGPEYLPDRIELYPLLPELAPDGSVDAGWCLAEYSGGSFARRMRAEVFVLLAQLRRVFALMAESD